MGTFSKQFSASALKFTDWGQDRSLITFNFEEGCYQENYENNSITANTIDEGEENLETEEVHDDSDSGIDSLYECIKFKTTASDSFHDPDRGSVKSPQRPLDQVSEPSLVSREERDSERTLPSQLALVLNRDPANIYKSERLGIDLRDNFDSRDFM